MTLTDIVKRAEKLTIDNSPAILTAMGVAGTVTTAYLTGKATVKATRLIDAANQQMRKEGKDDLTVLEKAKESWLLYLPAAGTGVITIACIVFANRIGNRRAAAMAAAYTISERAFSEYKEKVVEKLGEKQNQKIVDSVAQDRVTNDPPSKREVIVTGTGEVLFCDDMSGRYFKSTMETVRKAMNDVNQQIVHDNYASLTDFYNLIGLNPTAISDELGWNVDKFLKLEFSTTISEDDQPCIVVSYATAPVRNYFRLY